MLLQGFLRRRVDLGQARLERARIGIVPQLLQVLEQRGSGFRPVAQHQVNPRPRLAILGRRHLVDLAELLQPGRLSVLLLSGVPDDVRLVVIYLTLRKLLQARARASEAAKTMELGFATEGD